ncbi:MAG: type II toxin-antitoxin system RelE/ParE family toxin [Flavobacteriaceae bacterium]|jgi:plasmid stabilization system protein ParE|nr:type II toxin-antitoxin system RelE/ParE family toxin [Flavobacteriaceae bacterium]
MSYRIDWTFSAQNSYFEEIEFIYLKWNVKEVVKFEELIADELKRLKQNPAIGKLSNNIYSLTISKQTTLYYRINDKSKSIELILFWNNLKNPEDLEKLL